VKRRTVSCGEVIRGPSRIESMPNMRNGLGPTKRRERAAAVNARTNGAAVEAARKTRTKTTTVRYSIDAAGDDRGATPQTTTSRSSSVVVDVEATSVMSSVVDRASLPPPPPARPASPVSPSSAEFTSSLQSPVNSSGVRIVIDSDDDDDNDDNDNDDSDDNDDDNDDNDKHNDDKDNYDDKDENSTGVRIVIDSDDDDNDDNDNNDNDNNNDDNDKQNDDKDNYERRQWRQQSGVRIVIDSDDDDDNDNDVNDDDNDDNDNDDDNDNEDNDDSENDGNDDNDKHNDDKDNYDDKDNNSSGVRIVIDSDDDADNDNDNDENDDNNNDNDNNDDGGHEWSLTDVDYDAAAAHQRHRPDAEDTAATTFGSASSLASEDSSHALVMFHCGPSDDVDDDVIVTAQSTSAGYRSAIISGVVEAPASDASGFHLLSDSLV